MVKIWVRILLGVMALLILATSAPAYFSPSINPALEGIETLTPLALFVFAFLDAAGLYFTIGQIDPRVVNSAVFVVLAGVVIWQGLRSARSPV